MTLQITVRDGKQFTVEKEVLEICEFFKALFTKWNTIGGERSSIYVGCDSESFALLLRLLIYGSNAVPNESVSDHLKLILFFDANHLGVPSDNLEHLRILGPLKYAEFANDFKLSLPMFYTSNLKHCVVKSMTLQISCPYPCSFESFGKIDIYCGRKRHEYSVDKEKTTLSTIYLSIHGNFEFDEYSHISMSYSSTIKDQFPMTLQIEYYSTYGYADLCKEKSKLESR